LAGVQRERIIVDRLVPIGFQVTRGEELLQFARHLVASMVREAATS
jgi:hypothetical protein